jgi:hypothetical protein
MQMLILVFNVSLQRESFLVTVDLVAHF